MRRLYRCLASAGLVTALAVLTSCSYSTALRQLPPEEQAAFRTYSKAMTTRQAYAYLGKATAAERAAYLQEIGLAQRFQALTPQDRETVLGGLPRQGMSAEALLFLWGEPYYTRGRSGHFEYWHYLGSALALSDRGNVYGQAGTEVVVQLVDGQVRTWLETVPTNLDKGDGRDGSWR